MGLALIDSIRVNSFVRKENLFFFVFLHFRNLEKATVMETKCGINNGCIVLNMGSAYWNVQNGKTVESTSS